jgi:hypothetical protein
MHKATIPRTFRWRKKHIPEARPMSEEAVPYLDSILGAVKILVRMPHPGRMAATQSNKPTRIKAVPAPCVPCIKLVEGYATYLGRRQADDR